MLVSGFRGGGRGLRDISNRTVVVSTALVFISMSVEAIVYHVVGRTHDRVLG